MSAPKVEVAPLEHVWKAALEEYATQLQDTGLKLDLDKWKDVKNVEDLADRLCAEHGSFDSDVARGSSFTSALKAGFAPVTLMMNMLGGVASAAFAPCSQIFGAVAVLVEAGKNTGAAFDDIAGLFQDLSESTQLLKPLEKRRPPPELEKIIQGILVCLLSICALATKRTCHVPEKTKHRNLKQVLSGVKSNVTQFGRQLFFGEDDKITIAKASLKRLSEAQARMIGALTFEKVGDVKEGTERIETVVVELKGLNLEISSAIVELEADGKDMKFKLQAIGEVVCRVDFKLEDIREHMLTREDHEEGMALNREGFARIERMLLQSGGDLLRSGRATKAELSQSVTKHSKHLQNLRKLFDMTPTNQDFYDRIIGSELMPGTGDWILRHSAMEAWLDGVHPILSIAGNTGCGKTFLAARVIKHLLETMTEGTQRPSSGSVAFFFVSGDLNDSKSVTSLLHSTAYQIAQKDAAYAGYVDTRAKNAILDDEGIGALWDALFQNYFDECRGTAFLVLDAVDECYEKDVESLLEALKLTSTREDKGWPNSLRILLTNKSDRIDSISSAFADKCKFITVGKSENLNDISLVIRKKMMDTWHARPVSVELWTEAPRTVLLACQGNFSWAVLVMENLVRLGREDVIRKQLQNLPPDMSSALLTGLHRIARKLDDDTIEDLNDILAWVGCAPVDPSVRILDALLTLRSTDGARVIDLLDLIQNDFKGLFITTTSAHELAMVPVERTEERLGIDAERPTVDNAFGLSEQGIEGVDLLKGDLKETSPAVAKMQARQKSDLDQVLNSWDRTSVQLSHPILRNCIQHGRIEESLPQFRTDNMYHKVLHGCLKVLCMPKSSDNAETIETANLYCAVYFSFHLTYVDPENVAPELRQDIVNLLLKVLRDETVLDRWISDAIDNMTNEILIDDFFRECVVSWLETADHVPPEHSDWVSKAIEAPVPVLLGPLSRRIAYTWLETDAEDIASHVEYLVQWSSMLSNLDTSILDGDNVDTFELDGRALEIVRAATILRHERTARWFRRVGDALHAEELDDDARQIYLRGLELDPDDPKLLHGLALAYEEERTQEAWREAISRVLKAIELLEHQVDGSNATEPDARATIELLRDCQCRLGLYHMKLEQFGSASEAFKGLFEEWEAHEEKFDTPRSRSFNYYVQISCKQSDFAAATTMVERFVAHPRREAIAYFILCWHALQFSQLMLQLAWSTSGFDLLYEFWTAAMFSIAHFGGDGEVSNARYHRAIVILRLRPDRTDDAVKELYEIVKDNEIATPSNQYHWVKERAEKELGRIYLERALKAREKDRWQEIGANVDQLVRLCRIDPDSEQEELVGRDCSLILAVWNRLNGQKARAMRCARSKIEHGINVLTDANPENDLEAWQCFGDACLAVGDLERARAAVSMQKQLCQFGAEVIEGVTEEGEEEVEDDDAEDEHEGAEKDDAEENEITEPDETAEDDNEDPELDYTRECNGPCFSSIANQDTFYRCSYCLSDFCQPCHEEISKGAKKSFSVCSPLHEHFAMPSLSRKFKAGCVESNGKIIPVSEWLQSLKRAWGLLPDDAPRHKGPNLLEMAPQSEQQFKRLVRATIR